MTVEDPDRLWSIMRVERFQNLKGMATDNHADSPAPSAQLMCPVSNSYFVTLAIRIDSFDYANGNFSCPN